MPERKKICIVVSALGSGGAERSSALLSEILDHLGHEVHIVSILDQIDYGYEGELLNLGKIKSKFRLIQQLKKFKVLKSYLKKHGFDFVIDNHTRDGILKEIIAANWLYNIKKTIYCVRSFNTTLYFPPIKFLAQNLYRNAYAIVAVSDAIKQKIELEYGFDNVVRINNPVDNISSLKSNQGNSLEDYIIFYGRIVDDVKNISLLLNSYGKSILPEQGIALLILGDGPDLDTLKSKVIDLGLSNSVYFKPFTENPFIDVAHAKFSVLTSHYEGFPRMILESLSLGTPVVSVNCKSGPKEMIIDGFNGLLVENYNETKLSQAMNRMITDKDLYLKCKSNTKESVSQFSMENIGKDWTALLSKTI